MNDKSLAFKLNTSFLILLTFILCSALYSILMNNKTQGYADEVATDWFPSLDSVAKMNSLFSQVSRRHVVILTFYAHGMEDQIPQGFVAQQEKWRDDMTKQIETHKTQLVKLGGEEEVLIKKVEQAWQELLAEFEEEKKSIEKSPKIAFEIFLSKGLPKLLAIIKLLDELGKYNYENGVISSTKGNSLTAITNMTMAGIVIASVIISIIIFQIIRKSTLAISNAVNNLKSQSVLTSKIAGELKSSSQSLSDSVAEQAASVHETSAAINEITSMVNRTAENAKESTNVAKSASDKADEGQKTMQRLVQAMETIQESNGQLQNIAVIINQINSKTAVINDIVSKTELLSLNASIESARAGEYGKGFAVVAEEVGNLAKISGKAAHEIQELITTSQEQVNQILNITKERVADGKKVTTEAQESFLKITEDISNMSNVIQQISEATREQEIGVRQISTAMSQIDKATQNSQISVNTTSDSSNNLVDQSTKLDSTAKDIEKLIKGKVMNDSNG